MTQLDLLTALSRRMDESAGRIGILDQYYAGEQPLAYLAPEARTALGNRLTSMSTNLCRASVTGLAERLRVTGFTRGGQPDAALWSAWLRNDLDQHAAVAHREALALGTSYALVWADRQGRSQVSIESARQVAVQRDPGSREVTAAVKRWVGNGHAHAVVYQPDRISRYVSQTRVEDPSALPATAWSHSESIDNPFGVVPVVPFVNQDRLLDTSGRSELTDLLPLVDALNKLLADMMVASEFYARPRRWATGLELEENEDGEAVNPIPESNRTMVNESPEGKFGSLPGSDLAAYESAITILTSQIMAVTSLPAHYLGVLSSQPPSADALRASEASLTAKAEARQGAFGRSWEQVARLMVAADTGADPASVDVSVTWADPTTRSVAQEADSVVKLYSAGILPATYALARLGYTDAQIDAIRTARRAEALDTAGLDLKALGA